MKKPMTRILGLGSLACLLAHPAPAAEEGEQRRIMAMSLEQLQNVVVTDTKVAQSQGRVTQKVEVVEGAEIERQPTLNRNISELLMYRSGLFVNTLSRNDANWGSFGGLGPKYNGYLLDGLPIDSFVDGMSLDPWALERVELYKGPAAVMYSNYLTMDFAGNESPLAGITNFVLKERIDAPLTRIQLGGGSFGTASGKIYRQESRGKFHYFLGGNYEQSDYTNYGTPDSWLHILSAPDYRKGALYGKLSYFQSEEEKLSLFFHHTSHSGEVGRPNRAFDHDYDTLNLSYFNQLDSRWNLQLKGGYRGYDRRSGEDNFPPHLAAKSTEGVRQRIFPVDLSVNVHHLAASLLTFGADAQFADYRTYSEVGGRKTTNNQVSSLSRGLFLQEKVVLEQWVLRSGGRVNYTEHEYETINGIAPAGARERDWSQPLWSVGARYNAAAALAFYSNVGTSFVVPSAKQVWGSISDPLASGQLPNHALQEESGRGADLGLEWRAGERLTLGLRGFLNRLDDAIIDNVVSQLPSQSQAVNAGEARSQGVEGMADCRLNAEWHGFANFTYTSSEVKNPADRANDGSEIPFVPDWIVNAGLTAQLPGQVVLSPYLHLVGDYYDSTDRLGRHGFGSYLTANLRIEKVVGHSGAATVKAFLDLNNLSNERFEMPWGFRDPGFNAFVGLQATLF